MVYIPGFSSSSTTSAQPSATSLPPNTSTTINNDSSPITTSQPPPQRPGITRAPTTSAGLPHLRTPGHHDTHFYPPPLTWLQGTWWITHSSMSIWKDKRNITITYTPGPATHTPNHAKLETTQGTDRLDDVVEYQSASSTKIKEVRGRNVANADYADENAAVSANANASTAEEADGSGFDWRGKGIIAAAYSTWSIIGWGEEGGNKWMVTYFRKTVFTPAAVQMYSWNESGLNDVLVEKLKRCLSENGSAEVRKLATALYRVSNDGARNGTASPRGSLDARR